MTKFVHTADLHFGSNRYLDDYLRRQEEVFDSIFDVAYDNNISTVVIAGDIFDDPETTTPAEMEMVSRKMLEYDSAGFTILVIPGNHDLVDATGHTALHYLALLSDHGRFRHSCVTERTSYVTVDDTTFCLLCHRKGCFKEDSVQAARDYQTSSLLMQSDHFVMVAHEMIKGSETEIRSKSGYYRKLDFGESIPEAEDPDFPITYWALGDIHKVQAVSENAFYPGSPLQLKFGECWPKGVLVVDTESPTDPEFVPIDSNQLVKAKVGDDVPAGAYVKLIASSKAESMSSAASLPNVVKVEYASDTSSLVLASDDSLRETLLSGVAQLGATEEELELAEEEIDSILRECQDA